MKARPPKAKTLNKSLFLQKEHTRKMQISKLKKSYGMDELPVNSRQEFIKFLMDDAHNIRQLGLQNPKKVLNFYQAEILKCKTKIKINFEFDSKSYAEKKLCFGNVDLIVTFLRDQWQIVRGVPVWSFYRKNGSKATWTLDEDIKTDFDLECETYAG